MGLHIAVGILAHLNKRDREGAHVARSHFAAINGALEEAGLPPHEEPEHCAVLSLSGYGYTGLHALREVAGLLWKGHSIPRTELISGQHSPNEEELFQAILPFLVGDDEPGFWHKLTGRMPDRDLPPFAHVVAHPDSEGYYLPTTFPRPLLPEEFEDETENLWPVGSTQNLKTELAVLANNLEIPVKLRSGDRRIHKALKTKKRKTDGALWEAQPIAAYSALILREACDHSLSTGAAIAFV